MRFSGLTLLAVLLIPWTADAGPPVSAQQIDDWIRRTRPNSPLIGLGGSFIHNATTLDTPKAPRKDRPIDPRLAVAIAYAETALGTTGIAVNHPDWHNAWGLKESDGTFADVSTWQEMIAWVNWQLNLYRQRGWWGVDNAGGIFGPGHWVGGGASDSYIRAVRGAITELGGDPNDLEYGDGGGGPPQYRTAAANEFPHFLQGGGNWRDEHLGDSVYTMASDGCVVTSVAIVATYYGLGMNPKQMVDALNAIGGFSRGMIDWPKIETATGGQLRLDKPRETGSNKIQDCPIALEELAAGRPIIVKVSKYGGHWMIVYGRDGDRFPISDPLKRGGDLGSRYGYTITRVGVFRGPAVDRGPRIPNPGGGSSDPPLTDEWWVGRKSDGGREDRHWDAWKRCGGASTVGHPYENGGGFHVHRWGPPGSEGWIQDFDGAGRGAITRSDKQPSAYWIHGVIWEKHCGLGDARWTRLGWPTSDEIAVRPAGSDGVRTEFEGGAIDYIHSSSKYPQAAGRAYWMSGAVWSKYRSEGGAGKLGLLVADQVAIPGTGWEKAQFEQGEIISDGRNAWVVYCGPGYHSPGDGAPSAAYREAFLSKHVAWGHPSWCGTSKVQPWGPAYYQCFREVSAVSARSESGVGEAEGAIFAFSRGGLKACVLEGTVYRKYAAVGGPSGVLGLPTGDQTTTGGHRTAPFDNGRIVQASGSADAWAIWGAIAAKYNTLGALNSVVGVPQSDNTELRDGTVAAFSNGVIGGPASTAFAFHGELALFYRSLQFMPNVDENRDVGVPVADQVSVKSPVSSTPAEVGVCTGGAIVHNTATGEVHVVGGPIGARYVALGHVVGSRLGLPTTDVLRDQLSIYGLSYDYCTFENGAILHYNDGPPAVQGKTLVNYGSHFERWAEVGGPETLGAALTEPTRLASRATGNHADKVEFERGAIFILTDGADDIGESLAGSVFTVGATNAVEPEPNTGETVADPLSGYWKIYQAWRDSGGESGPLGIPWSNEFLYRDEFTNTLYRMQAFERGLIRWDSSNPDSPDVELEIHPLGIEPPPPDTVLASGPTSGSFVRNAAVEFTLRALAARGWKPMEGSNSPNALEPDYVPAQSPKYRWRVDGGAWSPASTSATAKLGTLSEGPHRFEAACTLSEQIHTEESDPTPLVVEFTVDTRAPKAPTGLSASIEGSGGVRLAWDGNQEGDMLAGYDVYRAASATGPFEPLVRAVQESAYLDESAASDKAHYYRLKAVDRAGNESPATAAVGAEPAGAVYSRQIKGLQLVSLPFAASDPAIDSLLAGDSFGIAAWDPFVGQSGDYRVYAPGKAGLTTLECGRGYWISSSSGATIQGRGREASGDGPQVLHLHPGWNLIGTPSDRPITWDPQSLIVSNPHLGMMSLATAAEQGVCHDYAWGYDPGTGAYDLVYSATMSGGLGTLEPWQGYWIKVGSEGCDLSFPAEEGARAAVAGASARQASASCWDFRLIASVGGVDDDGTFIGVTDRPGSGSGAHRVYEPPRPPSGQAIINCAVVDAEGARMAVDLREATGAALEWEVIVETAVGNATVSLSWPDLRYVPRHLRPVLVDEATGRTVAMRTAEAYEFQSASDGESRRFRIVVDPSHRTGLSVSALTVEQARAGATVVFMLSRSAEVTVRVLNAAGRVVRVLQSAGPSVAGRNEVYWDGRSDTGAQTPAGWYRIHIQAQAEDGERATGTASVDRM